MCPIPSEHQAHARRKSSDYRKYIECDSLCSVIEIQKRLPKIVFIFILIQSYLILEKTLKYSES